MNLTTDMLTDRPYFWNTTVAVRWCGHLVTVPAYTDSEIAHHLHPDRVEGDLLAALNPELAAAGHLAD
jgi:hypothetical protein